ncbi:PfkB family carbohydrate kinase [Streptomyces chrestomyceticus]|uniref:PfkB family carbohydrate kinase n=1 Tax=Streptomyces chrestomyceticus TaxID=68185 RepID=UPI0035A9526C
MTVIHGSPAPMGPAGRPGVGRQHLDRLRTALGQWDVSRIESWGARLADVLVRGGRLLVAGNGGSAAEAQHLTAELVGRFQDERQPFSAIALHTDTSSVTAITNDYGMGDMFARQVRAHGRTGDVLLCLSTSGRSQNLLEAVKAAHELRLESWALTGRAGGPLAELSGEAVRVPSSVTTTIQECHLAAVHMLCVAVEGALRERGAAALGPPRKAGPTPHAPAAPKRTEFPRPGHAARQPARIAVVGDALLDLNVVGSVKRLSPEAPVPVVGELETRSRPGGAGLAAMLAAREGHDVSFVTALADDPEGEELRAMLAAVGVQVLDLGLDGRTPVKTRVRTGHRTLLMLDGAEEAGPPPTALTEEARDMLRTASAILVSDYGRGVADQPALRDLLTELASTTPVVWDPHVRGPAPVPGTCLVTPNSREAAYFAEHAGADGLGADIERTRALLRRWNVSRIAVTRGDAGAVLVQDVTSAPLVATAEPVTASDTCGAGDRFAASVTVRLAQGILPSEAVSAAVRDASAYVAAGAASAVWDADDGDVSLSPEQEGRRDPLELARRTREGGGRVVVAGGCFDVLHAGHVALLREARRLGDCLIVCVNSDASVSRLKGPRRPVVSEADRTALLLALQDVDAVLVFDEDTPSEALERLRPHIFVKGGDYTGQEIPEARADWDGEVVIVPYLAGRSTTSLIRRAGSLRDE